MLTYKLVLGLSPELYSVEAGKSQDIGRFWIVLDYAVHFRLSDLRGPPPTMGVGL